MIYRSLLAALTVLLTVSLLVPVEDAYASTPTEPTLVPARAANDEVMAVEHEYLVKGTREALQREGLDVIREAGFGWSLVRSLAPGSPSGEAARLTRQLGVPAVPNIARPLSGGELEPLFVDQWGLLNTGQSGGMIDADVDALEAWTVTEGRGAIVAVLDTGIDANHPDLSTQLWNNSGETPGNGIDDDGNGYVDDTWGWDFVSHDNNPDDGFYHGTFVAGIIGAAVNGYGMAGLAPNSRLMSVRVCSTSCFDSDTIAGLDYAVSNGARVANLSFGATGAFGSIALEEAVRLAGEAGLLVVAASGNVPELPGRDNDIAPVYPASFPFDSVVAVAATDHTDALSSFSHYGSTSVDLGAPGEGILSTVPLWFDPVDDHVLGDGTSFAAPFVSGAAALALSINPCLTPGELRNVLLSGTDPVGSLAGKTVSGGRLNADRAVRATPTSLGSSAIAMPALGGIPFTVALSATSKCDRFGEIASYDWAFGDGTVGSGQDVGHTYSVTGIYDVALTARGGDIAEQAAIEIVAGIDFDDDDTNPFESEIIWLSARGITLGCSATGFCPLASVTRGQMASFLARALDLPPATKDWFTDDGGPHQGNINRLAESGITRGCTVTEFCPRRLIARGQMAALLYRAEH
jgi:hypothetical protein